MDHHKCAFNIDSCIIVPVYTHTDDRRDDILSRRIKTRSFWSAELKNVQFEPCSAGLDSLTAANGGGCRSLPAEADFLT